MCSSDLDREHAREEVGVEHMRHIGRAQEVFEAFGIVPNYVIDTIPSPASRWALRPCAATRTTAAP